MRLEEKGYLKSHMGGATSERGGRDKRLYTLTQAGVIARTEELHVQAGFKNCLGRTPRMKLTQKSTPNGPSVSFAGIVTTTSRMLLGDLLHLYQGRIIKYYSTSNSTSFYNSP